MCNVQGQALPSIHSTEKWQAKSRPVQVPQVPTPFILNVVSKLSVLSFLVTLHVKPGLSPPQPELWVTSVTVMIGALGTAGEKHDVMGWQDCTMRLYSNFHPQSSGCCASTDMPPAISSAALNIRACVYMILHGFTQPSWAKYCKMLSDNGVCLHGVCAKRSWAKLHSEKLDIQEVLRKNEVNQAGRRATMKEEKNRRGRSRHWRWERLTRQCGQDCKFVINPTVFLLPISLTVSHRLRWSYAKERFVQHSCLCRFHSIPVVIVPRFRTATVLQIKVKGENGFTFQRTVTWIP